MTIPLATRMVWLATGLILAARSLIGLAHPAYIDPVTTLDWAAVWSFSLGWILLALSILFIARLAPTREVSLVSTIVAIGALAAGAANAVEDGLGQRAWGTVYIIGSLTGWFGLLALAVVVARAGLRRLAFAVVTIFLGFALGSTGNVLAIIGASLAIGALGGLAVFPAWFATPDIALTTGSLEPTSDG